VRPDRSLSPNIAHCQTSTTAEHSIPLTERSFAISEKRSIDNPDITQRSSSRAACDDFTDLVRSHGNQSEHPHMRESDPVADRRSPKASSTFRIDDPASETALIHPRPFPQVQPSSSAASREGDIDTRTRAFSCPLEFCQRPFRRLEHLKRHVRTHTRERPYLCGQCGRSFSRQDNLLQHIRTHPRNGRSDNASRIRIDTGSAIISDVAVLPRSVSEWPRQSQSEDSPGFDTPSNGDIGHSAGDAYGGRKSRANRLYTAPPG